MGEKPPKPEKKSEATEVVPQEESQSATLETEEEGYYDDNSYQYDTETLEEVPQTDDDY